jgi:hypothetical protein
VSTIQVAPNTDIRLPTEISSALDHLDSWIEQQAFCGWDPHDALNSPLLRLLTIKNRFAGIFWVQLLKRNPINLRPVLGIAKGYNPKGMGLFLASYTRKYATTHDPRHRQYLVFFTRWLLENVTKGYRGLSWGYNFDWPNRAFFAPAGTPTIVNTAFIALAFLDVHSRLTNEALWPGPIGDGSTGILNYHSPLEVARSSCDFVLNDLHRLSSTADEFCFSYTPLDHRPVHNASMMGAWLLASVFRETREPELRRAALAAARFTAHRQLPDGSWPYGEATNDRWVDNFHTGFVLVALKSIGRCLQTDEFDHCVLRGYQFWKERMFLQDGTPKYYPNSTLPLDVHSVAQAILTFLEFEDHDSEALAHAIRVTRWGIKNLQDPSGYFYYQIRRGYTIRIPYIRWAQAWMQRALTELRYSHL